MGVILLNVIELCQWFLFQTALESFKAFKLDLNLVYWSNDEKNVEAEIVQGKCYVRAEPALSCSPQEWTEAGEYRFYYSQVI